MSGRDGDPYHSDFVERVTEVLAEDNLIKVLLHEIEIQPEILL